MSDPKTDALLRTYLEEKAEERARGVTLDTVHEAVVRIGERQIASDQRLDRAVRRIRALEIENERRSAAEPGDNWKPDPSEVTGTWEYAQIRAELKEHKSDARWLKRQGVQWIGAAVGAVVMAMVSAIVAFLVAKFTK